MSEKMPSRKSCTPLKVYCLPTEKARIEANARDAGMSTACFLREVGQGYRVRGIVDCQQVRELARINGDLGRLGGLLKLWLTDDIRTAQFGTNTILRLLERIETNQNQMAEVMRAVMRPKTES